MRPEQFEVNSKPKRNLGERVQDASFKLGCLGVGAGFVGFGLSSKELFYGGLATSILGAAGVVLGERLKPEELPLETDEII